MCLVQNVVFETQTKHFSINTSRQDPPRERQGNIPPPPHCSLSQCISQGHHLINSHKPSRNTTAYQTAGFFISLRLSLHLFRLAADKRKSKAPDTHFSWWRDFISLWSTNKIQFQRALFSIWKTRLWLPRPLSDKDSALKMFTCVVLSKVLISFFCKCHHYICSIGCIHL